MESVLHFPYLELLSRSLAPYSLGLDFEEVRISSYCPLWPVIFSAEKMRIEAGLAKTGLTETGLAKTELTVTGIAKTGNGIVPAHISIEHVGSTSVPGCAAKPVMDMVAFYQREEDRDAIVTGLMALGYLYLGQCGRQGRDFFVFNRGHRTLFHLHLVPAGHPVYRDLLDFRRRLMTSPNERDRYIRFKRNLAASYPGNRTLYRLHKSMFFE